MPAPRSHRRPAPPRHPPRAAFTLVELLIVIAIMALLTASIVVVYARSGENARIASTKTLIKQLDSVLKERLEAFRRFNFRPAAKVRFPTLGADQAEVAFRTEQYRQSFPQRFQDLYGIDGLHGDSSMAQQADNAALYFLIRNTKLPAKTISELEGTPTVPSVVSSSELFYLAMTEGPSFGSAPFLVEGIDARMIQDTDGDGLPSFVDAWGQELRFYNAPTALLRPNGNVYDVVAMMPDNAGQPLLQQNYLNARVLISTLPPWMPGASGWRDYDNSLNIDPYDTLGDLAGSLLQSNGDLTDEQNFERRYHSVNTFYAPLLVSPGPDQSLGMYEPNETSNPGPNDRNRLGGINLTKIDEVYDNLTNQQRGGF